MFSWIQNKCVRLFKTNTPKRTVYGKGKRLRKPKTQKIRNPFLLKMKKKQIKDTITRDIWTLFETEKIEKERKK